MDFPLYIGRKCVLRVAKIWFCAFQKFHRKFGFSWLSSFNRKFRLSRREQISRFSRMRDWNFHWTPRKSLNFKHERFENLEIRWIEMTAKIINLRILKISKINFEIWIFVTFKARKKLIFCDHFGHFENGDFNRKFSLNKIFQNYIFELSEASRTSRR